MNKVFSRREKVTFWLTLIVIGGSVLFNFIVLPWVNSNERLNKEIAVASARLNKYISLLGRKDEITAKLNSFSSPAQLADQRGDSTIAILSQIESIAKDSGVRIVDIRPQSGYRQEAGLTAALVDVRIEADMAGMLKFAYSVENSLVLLQISRFQISVKPNNTLLEGYFSISQLS